MVARHWAKLWRCAGGPELAWFSTVMRFPGGSVGKESGCNAGDLSSIPGSGRSPGEGYPLQYSCLGNPMDKRAW